MSSQLPEHGSRHEEPISLHPEASAEVSPRILHGKSGSIPVEDLESPGVSGLIRTIGNGNAVQATSERETAESQLTRPLNLTGGGATRCRTFSCKLSDASIAHMDMQINQWLDAGKAEVKFCSTTVGRFEGKTPENKLVVTLWY